MKPLVTVILEARWRGQLARPRYCAHAASPGPRSQRPNEKVMQGKNALHDLFCYGWSLENLLPSSLLDQLVNRDRQDQQQSRHDQSDFVFHAHQVQAVLDSADNESTQQRCMH